MKIINLKHTIRRLELFVGKVEFLHVLQHILETYKLQTKLLQLFCTSTPMYNLLTNLECINYNKRIIG